MLIFRLLFRCATFAKAKHTQPYVYVILSSVLSVPRAVLFCFLRATGPATLTFMSFISKCITVHQNVKYRHIKRLVCEWSHILEPSERKFGWLAHAASRTPPVMPSAAFTFLLARLLASSCLSVGPSVCPHGPTRLPLDGFSWNSVFEHFSRKSMDKIQVSLKSKKHNAHFTLWRLWGCDNVSLN